MSNDDISTWLRQKAPSLTNLHTHILIAGGIVDRWHVCSFLGQGGTSEVYRVTQGDIEAALKIARNPEQPDITARFEREAQLLQSLHSRYFPAFYAAGTHERRPYLVTELLQPLTPPETDSAVANLALQLTDALGELHQLGHVHRDVKPANILTRDGRTPVLVDLGYAKPIDTSLRPPPKRGPLSQTVCQFFGLGTPGYAAPEQFTGDIISPAADIHALGVSLNDCFNGNPPHDWEPIIRRATSSLPTQRYATTHDFARAIRHRHARHWRHIAVGILLGTIVGTLAVRTLIVSLTEAISDQMNHVYVSADAPSGGDGSRSHPFSTITNALGHVPWFGTISVAPGTYNGPIYIYDKLITIKSEQGPEKTIIRAPETEGLTVDHNGVTNNANLVVYIGSKGEGTLIEGFTLTGGKGAWRAGKLGGGLADRAGGGILCEASATIQNCRIVDNGLPTVEWGKWTRDQLRDGPCLGGGVFVNNGNVNLQDCVISNNFAWLAGGGVCIEGKGATLVMERCTVVRNRIAVDKNDRRVGGVAVLRHGTANLSQCKILDNDDDQVGTLAGRLSVGTTLSLNASRITGGARPGRIIHFHADPESMADAGTNTTITATEPPKP